MGTTIIERVRSARSWLFTPGNRPDRFDRAAATGADAVILDLEDAVAPAQKAAAREDVVRYLSADRTSVIVQAVRINAPSTTEGQRDLVALSGSATRPDVVVIPKVESAEQLAAASDALRQGSGPDAAVIPIVESAVGVCTLRATLADPGPVAAVLVGAADLAADIGGRPDWDVLVGARSAIRVVTAAAGLPLIDSPFFDPRDADGLLTETQLAVRFGFDAKAAIHPAQVPVVNTAFTPTGEQIAWARQVLAVNEAGVGTVDGQMVDEAVARRARKILGRTH